MSVCFHLPLLLPPAPHSDWAFFVIDLERLAPAGLWEYLWGTLFGLVWFVCTGTVSMGVLFPKT